MQKLKVNTMVLLCKVVEKHEFINKIEISSEKTRFSDELYLGLGS